jgi:hypothetical protein
MVWNKGLTKEDERVMKYVQKKIGIKRTLEQRKKMSESHSHSLKSIKSIGRLNNGQN